MSSIGRHISIFYEKRTTPFPTLVEATIVEAQR